MSHHLSVNSTRCGQLQASLDAGKSRSAIELLMQHLVAIYLDVKKTCENLATWDSPNFFIVDKRCHLPIF